MLGSPQGQLYQGSRQWVQMQLFTIDEDKENDAENLVLSANYILERSVLILWTYVSC